jgi:hypothetical protein
MYIAPTKRLSASHKAVLAAESFHIPMIIHSVAKSSRAALDGLRQAFDEISVLVQRAAGTAPGIALVDFGDSPSPRRARVALTVGKEHEFMLSFTLKCPIPADMDFWGRVDRVSWVFERFDELGTVFLQRKGLTLTLEGASLAPDGATPHEPAEDEEAAAQPFA